MFQLLIALIFMSFISLGLPDALLGAAWPSMYSVLGASVSSAGIISFIITCGTIISSLLSDRLVRRLGTGLLTAVSVALTAVGLFGFSFSHSFFLLCCWAVPYGLGAGSVDAALNNFVALHFKSVLMNWLHCFWGVGASIGPYIMGQCLNGQSGWNGGYQIVAIIQSVLAVFLFLSLRVWKQKLPYDGQEQVKNEKEIFQRVPLRQLVNLPGARAVFISFFFYCALETSTGQWGASYLAMYKGVPKNSAASVIALFYLGITAGRFLSGFISLKFSDKQMIRGGQFLAGLGIFILLFSSGTAGAGTGFGLIGLGCAPVYPAIIHQTPSRFGQKNSQAMIGMQMASAYVGNALMPPVTGIVIGQISAAVFPFLLFGYLICMFLFVEQVNKKTKPDRAYFI